MSTKFSFLGVLILMPVFYSVVAEDIAFLPCTNNKTTLQKCNIHRVVVNPCPKVRTAGTERCQFSKGTKTTLIVDFTPNFKSKSLKTQAYVQYLLWDVPMPGQDTNGCHFTSCPTVPGKKQTFTDTLEIKNSYPKGEYTILWKLWNEKDEDEVCCVKANIKIV